METGKITRNGRPVSRSIVLVVVIVARNNHVRRNLINHVRHGPRNHSVLGDIILRHRRTSILAAVLRHIVIGEGRRLHRHITTVCRALCLHALWHHRQGTAHL